MAKKWLMATELGVHLDMTAQNVSRLVKSGVFRPDAKTKKYHADVCRVSYIRHIREKAAGRDTSANLEAQRERQARLRGDQLEMANQLAAGSLLKREDVLAAWQSVVTTARARVLGMPDRLAPLLITVEDLAEAHSVIKDYAFEILENLASEPIQPGHKAASRGSRRNVAAAGGNDGVGVGGRKTKA